MRRRKDKVDANQPEIVKALRAIPGVSVELGHDDVLVGYQGRTYWYEIKTPECVGKDGNILESKKKDCQKVLEAEWKGHYRIIHCIEQILDDIGIDRATATG